MFLYLTSAKLKETSANGSISPFSTWVGINIVQVWLYVEFTNGCHSLTRKKKKITSHLYVKYGLICRWYSWCSSVSIQRSWNFFAFWWWICKHILWPTRLHYRLEADYWESIVKDLSYRDHAINSDQWKFNSNLNDLAQISDICYSLLLNNVRWTSYHY